jgi:ferredoxin
MCDVCGPEWLSGAISQGAKIYETNPALCTECAGHFSKPQFQQVCPIDCIPFKPDLCESHEQLHEKYLRLLNGKFI